MSTYTQILYHIVFSTKNREPVLEKQKLGELYRYIGDIVQKRDGHLYGIGGAADHVHLLCSLHPAVALTDLVKEIKTATSSWIKSENIFPDFGYWQSGYGAFTCSPDAKEHVVQYIMNQERHHETESSPDELKRLLAESGIEYDVEYFE
ncbi:IS200/IS605 family transposase [Pontiella sp.]|uniref:IS200/IS605 family transposase n=1 Tax=Pontiella sp. TaxID=2837462 RepID=UPI0035666E58